MENKTLDIAILEFKDIANKVQLHKTDKDNLKSAGVNLAESLADKFLSPDFTDDIEGFIKALDMPRAAQQYMSRAKKVSIAIKNGLIERNKPILTLYDNVLEVEKKQKEHKQAVNQGQAKVYGMILAACDGDTQEADRIMANPASPEYIEAITNGQVILAEKEAEEERLTRRENMEKEVANVKAFFAFLAEEGESSFLMELAQEAGKLAKVQKQAKAA